MFLVTLVFIALSGILTVLAMFERDPRPKTFIPGGVFALLAIASAILSLVSPRLPL